jgi:hypothetical protein
MLVGVAGNIRVCQKIFGGGGFGGAKKYISEGNSEYLLPCDSWANNVFPDDLPHASIVPVCWGGYEPSVPFQGFGSVDGALFVSDGSGSVVGDISSADGVLGPALHQPIEE